MVPVLNKNVAKIQLKRIREYQKKDEEIQSKTIEQEESYQNKLNLVNQKHR